ncbi:MAG: hypothetical protein NTW87_29630 [Planctomycetota bacterium]|nr:hypothetical protein [Planctomycetota bacterium]
MPPTTENIAEKPVFNVYGTMLILSFLILLGATLLLNDDLDKHWGFWVPKEDPSRNKRAVHITQLNEEPDKYPDIASVTTTDLDDWKLIKGEGAAFPYKDLWPQGYNPLQNPVKANTDNLQAVPQAQRDALMKDWTPTEGGAAEKPAAAPTETQPAPPEKKEGAPAEEKKAAPAEEKKAAPAEEKKDAAPAEEKK